MAKKPTKDTSKASDDEKDMVRKIWLAGIGAYGRAFSEAKGAVDSLTGKSSAVFDELVQKGQVLEAVGKYKAEEFIGKGKSAVSDIKPDLDIDDRIAKMRARLSGKGQSNSEHHLAERVDAIEAKLELILAKLDGVGTTTKTRSTRSTRSKTTAAKKPSKAKTAKTPSKKKMTTQRTVPSSKKTK